jgi:hypothetical protein
VGLTFDITKVKQLYADRTPDGRVQLTRCCQPCACPECMFNMARSEDEATRSCSLREFRGVSINCPVGVKAAPPKAAVPASLFSIQIDFLKEGGDLDMHSLPVFVGVRVPGAAANDFAVVCATPNKPLTSKSEKLPMPDGSGHTFQYPKDTVLLNVRKLIPMIDPPPRGVIVEEGYQRYIAVGGNRPTKTLEDMGRIKISNLHTIKDRHAALPGKAVLEKTKPRSLVYHIRQVDIDASQCLVVAGEERDEERAIGEERKEDEGMEMDNGV